MYLREEIIYVHCMNQVLKNGLFPKLLAISPAHNSFFHTCFPCAHPKVSVHISLFLPLLPL